MTCPLRSTGTGCASDASAAIRRSAGPKVSRVRMAATRPIAAYRLNRRAGPIQPKLTNSSVVTNGVNPDTIAEIW